MCGAAVQRPRTQFQQVRWSELQPLLRERDYPLSQADEAARTALLEGQRNDYGRGRG